MTTSTAIVPTESASRYLQQLCKHWGHKFTVDFTPEAGRIEFPMGPIVMAADAEALTVTLEPGPDVDLGKMQQVVAEHLNRFAHREGELVFDWQDA